MEALRRRLRTTEAPPLHKAELSRFTIPNRIFALLYASAVVTLLYHHTVTLSKTHLFISTSLLLSDVVLAVIWVTSQSFRIRPIYRKEFPQYINKESSENEFPAIDVFVCTADPYKEPPMNVVNTVISAMGFDYPTEKVSVYVSDDGGSDLTLFGLMEGAKFAAHWLPFCVENDVVQRFYGINKNDTYACEVKRLFFINAIGMDGLSGPNYVGTGCFFRRRVFFGGPLNLVLPEMAELGPDHVVSNSIQSKQVMDLAHCVASCNYENNTQWGHKMGVRYGSLVEDFYTGYRLQCEGWKAILCNPVKAAFYGDFPISLVDVLNQQKRWAIGLLEVTFSKYSPFTFGTHFMGLVMGFTYGHYSLWPIWSIPVAIYAFLPQLALLNGLPIFPKISEPLFILYLFLVFGAYGQDLLEFVIEGGTLQKWWNDQRMWMIRALTCGLFGTIEYSLKCLGISSSGFALTSKVAEAERSKRYKQGVFEFGIHSPMFVTLTTVAIINLAALIWGLKLAISGSKYGFEQFFMQVILAAFVVVNCQPIYGAIFLETNKGGIPTKTTLVSIVLASSLLIVGFLALR
uniref:Cellulose synthase-like protein G3 n=1 Tax=Cannabis sativa TaxID=3483 RepID=A0A803PP36_CANSA